MVRFHEDLEAEGGEGESSGSSLSNQYGNKSAIKKEETPVPSSSSDSRSSKKEAGLFAKIFNFKNNKKFEESMSKSSENENQVLNSNSLSVNINPYAE